MKMWMCDGGDFVGTEYEVELHVLDVNEGKDIEDVKCWGCFPVGSETHIAYLNGSHPMALITLNPAIGQYREPVMECLT